MKKTIEVIERGIDEGLHPGAQLYVWRKGDVAIDAAFGEARPGVPMTIDTVQLWMSAGKPITAVAVLQLVERGLLTLDTRIAEVIPEFAAGGKDAITVRHCLTHTAGFRGPLNNFTPGPWEEILQRVYALRLEPNWTPGQKAGYHVGSSWFALGEVMQRVTGLSFQQYVHLSICEPVATHLTFTRSPEDECVDGAKPALVVPDFPGNTLDGVARPGASARGPIRALARIYQSLLRHDGKLLSPQMSQLMVSRQREGMFDETFKETVDWGLGVKLDSKRYGKTEQYGYGPHASDVTFGHSGNQCSCAFADPQHDLVVAWCTNGMPGEPKHQARQNAINGAIYEDLGLA